MSQDPHDPAQHPAQDPFSFDPAQQGGGVQPEAEGLPDEDGSWFLQDDLAEQEPAQTEQFEAVGALPDELGTAPVHPGWDEAAQDLGEYDDEGAFDAAVTPLNDEDLVGASYVEPESTRGVLVRALIPGAIVLVLAFGAVGAVAIVKDGSLDSLLGTAESPDVDVRRSAPKRRAPGEGAELASVDGGVRVGTRIGQTRDGSTFEAGSAQRTVEAPREPGELGPAEASRDITSAPGRALRPPTTDRATAGIQAALDAAVEAGEVQQGATAAAGTAVADAAPEPRPASEPPAVARAVAGAAPGESGDDLAAAASEGASTPAPTEEPAPATAPSRTESSTGGAAEAFVFGAPASPAPWGDEPFIAVADAPPGVFGEADAPGTGPSTENPLAMAFAAVGHGPAEPTLPLELVFATAGANSADGATAEGTAPRTGSAASVADANEPALEGATAPAADDTFAYVPFGFVAESGDGLEVTVSERVVEAEPAAPVGPAAEIGADEPRGDDLAAAEARLDEVFGPVGPGSPFDPITSEAPRSDAGEPRRSTVYPLPGENGPVEGGDVASDQAPAAGDDVAGADAELTTPDAPRPPDAGPEDTDAAAPVAPVAVGPVPEPIGPTVAKGTDDAPEEPEGTGATESEGPEIADSEAEVRPSIADQIEQKRRGGVLNRIDDGSVWRHRTVPTTKIRGDQFVLTPKVGNVRVVFAGGETIDGRLHGVGDGQVVLFTKIGRVKLESKRVDRIDRLGGSRELPDPTAQSSRRGLEHVRVRTKGGVFDGHLVSREGDKVTLLMGKGVRVTLEAVEVTPFKGVRAGARIRREEGGAKPAGGASGDGR